MKHITVVALSGGKDSTAMALRLQEIEPDIERHFVFTPTEKNCQRCSPIGGYCGECSAGNSFR